MSDIYESHGIRFAYPAGWELAEQQENENEITVTVQSPGTSFWLLTLLLDQPDPQRISEAALGAFRQEYDDLDAYPAKETICDQVATAWDVEFRCLEIYNSAWIRAFRADQFSVLILAQAYDRELPETGELLKNITRSLHCSAIE